MVTIEINSCNECPYCSGIHYHDCLGHLVAITEAEAAKPEIFTRYIFFRFCEQNSVSRQLDKYSCEYPSIPLWCPLRK